MLSNVLDINQVYYLIQKEKTNYKNDPALIKEDACKTEKGRDSMDKLIQQLI